MPNIYLITASCGDFYCGCGIGHVLCATTHEPTAQEFMEKAKLARDKYGGTWKNINIVLVNADGTYEPVNDETLTEVGYNGN